MYVYLIINKTNNKKYIGQTINSIEHRWNQHISHSRNLKRSGSLCSAIRKYGSENFEIKMLSRCNSIEELNHRETYYIKLLNTISPNGYNLDSGGKNNIMHDETKRKLSVAHIGKKRGPHSEEHRRRISEANRGQNKGIPLSEEVKLKISNSTRGEKNHNFGKKLSEKTINALIEANRGNKYWLNKKHNQKSKDKISKAQNKNKKPILCLNNNTVYDSLHAASRELSVGRKEINRNISGEISHVKGFIFKKA